MNVPRLGEASAVPARAGSAGVGSGGWEAATSPGGDLFFTAVIVISAVLVATASGPASPWRFAAAGLLVGCWLAGVAAQRARVSSRGLPVIAASLAALVALFAGAGVISQFSMAALFALGPMCFRIFPVGYARVAVAILAIVPALHFLVSPPDRAELVTYLSLAAVVVGFSLTTASWMCRVIEQSSERAELIRRLEQAQVTVEQLSEERGVLRERERLSREIHDTLAQGFTSIIMLIEAAEATVAPHTPEHRHLMLAARTARENLAEARALVAETAPASLSDSLAAALHRLADRMSGETGVAVSVAVAGLCRSLPAEQEIALLRVAQEALSNIRRHAHARSVRLTLDFEASAVVLTLRDDGRGFDTTAAAGGFGLRNMHSRSAEAGGRLELRSAQGAGTTVRCEIPVPAGALDASGVA
jgi:signal transduction histidine kinase